MDFPSLSFILETLKAASSGTSRAHLIGEHLSGITTLHYVNFSVLKINFLNLFCLFGFFQEGGYTWSLLPPLDQEQKSESI